jgi:hypothetical protein
MNNNHPHFNIIIYCNILYVMNILVHCKNHESAIHHLLWQIVICHTGLASKPIGITKKFVRPHRTIKIAWFCGEPQRVRKGGIKIELVIGVFGILPRFQTCQWLLPWAVSTCHSLGSVSTLTKWTINFFQKIVIFSFWNDYIFHHLL